MSASDQASSSSEVDPAGEPADLPDFDARWDYGDPGKTEAIFREILSEHSGAPKNWRLELETQIARTFSLRGEFDRAHAVLDEVEPELGDAERPRIRYLLERGRTFNSAGKKEQARALFDRAFELAREADEDRLAVDAAHMLGIVHADEKALEWNLTALDIAQNSPSEGAQKWKGSLYNNIGFTYLDMGEHQKALEMFQKGVAFRKEQGKDEPLRIARWTVAHTLRKMGRCGEALDKLRAIQRDFPDTDDPYVEEELGECLLAKGQEEEARPHFQRAYEGLKDDTWLQKNEPARLERLEKLASAGE